MDAVIYTVKEFNELVNVVLSSQIGEVTITGEVSGYQIRQNKWVSFDIKDQGSVLNCFCAVYQLDFPLEDGQEVLITGTPRIYVPYGKYSFNVRNVQLKGEGALRKAYEELKTKLEVEGLFVEGHKKPLPRFPERIGIVTSGEGAAINDILKVINQRWSGLQLFLIPVLVQGKNAPDELVGALDYFNKHHPVDVIIFGRGGGSLEDLQAFNSERVARAIFASRIPIVTGIGHEHNTSIADLVADVRAATPSNAAELTVPDREAIKRMIDLLVHKSQKVISTAITQHHHALHKQAHSIQLHLTRQISDIRRTLDHSVHQLIQTMTPRFSHARNQLSQRTHRLHLVMSQQMGGIELLIQRVQHYLPTLRQTIEKSAQQLHYTYVQILTQFSQQIDQSTNILTEDKKLLHVLNPTAILQRGYSITYHSTSGKPIAHLANIPPDGRIRTQVSDGSFESIITQTNQQTLF